MYLKIQLDNYTNFVHCLEVLGFGLMKMKSRIRSLSAVPSIFAELKSKKSLQVYVYTMKITSLCCHLYCSEIIKLYALKTQLKSIV